MTEHVLGLGPEPPLLRVFAPCHLPAFLERALSHGLPGPSALWPQLTSCSPLRPCLRQPEFCGCSLSPAEHTRGHSGRFFGVPPYMQSLVCFLISEMKGLEDPYGPLLGSRLL